MYEKLKQILKNDAVFYPALVVLVGAGAFMLGRVSDGELASSGSAATIVFEEGTLPRGVAPAPAATGTDSQVPAPAPLTTGQYVGSRSSDKYHLPWCPGALRIKEENKVWFASKEDAEARGYSPAANCKGI